MQDLKPFFESRHFIEKTNRDKYQSMQLGANILYPLENDFNWDDADIVIVGCGEWRGENENAGYSAGPDSIRKELYELYSWHPSIRLADAGNIRQGASLEDTRAALRTVLQELHEAGKTVIVLGGSHDLTVQQYEVFKKAGEVINISVTDMLVDLDETETVTSRSFLMDMLTGQPNYVGHYSHIGFQSYYAHPRMMETLDKLRFDFFRLGRVRDHMEDMEPVLRNSNIFSFDMSAIRYSDAPTNIYGSPNGFTGDEACMLTRYAGMSNKLTSFGIYGYDNTHDSHCMTAKLISQMIWYFADGYLVRKNEADLADEHEFMSFHVTFTDNDTIFLKSKRTNRWWMRLPDSSYIPCAYNDYQTASNDQIPERWLREQERLL
jgi:arginase family enzyme